MVRPGVPGVALDSSHRPSRKTPTLSLPLPSQLPATGTSPASPNATLTGSAGASAFVLESDQPPPASDGLEPMSWMCTKLLGQ
jgi:hypothetical protein